MKYLQFGSQLFVLLVGLWLLVMLWTIKRDNIALLADTKPILLPNSSILPPDANIRTQLIRIDAELGTAKAKERESQTKISVLEKQVEELSALINPTKATEVLTIARIKQEIQERSAFEQKIETLLEKHQKQVETIVVSTKELATTASSRIDTMFYWLLGICTGLIAAGVGIAGAGWKIFSGLKKELSELKPVTSNMPPANPS